MKTSAGSGKKLGLDDRRRWVAAIKKAGGPNLASNVRLPKTHIKAGHAFCVGAIPHPEIDVEVAGRQARELRRAEPQQFAHAGDRGRPPPPFRHALASTARSGKWRAAGVCGRGVFTAALTSENGLKANTPGAVTCLRHAEEILSTQTAQVSCMAATAVMPHGPY